MLAVLEALDKRARGSCEATVNIAAFGLVFGMVDTIGPVD